MLEKLGCRIHEFQKREDDRGSFAKPFVRDLLRGGCFEELYIVTARPGEIRGNHFHKRTNEWFFLLAGSATVHLMERESQQRLVWEFRDSDNCVLFVPSGITHAFKNNQDKPFKLLAITDQPYQTDDTVSHEIA
jgi:dTDP-4-dehydrorhamnose 3,5-epimerase